jgi:uncharacterized protein
VSESLIHQQAAAPARVLVLPGWQGSGPGHWQSRWEDRHGYLRVQQHDWMNPLRGDWMAQLEEAVLQDETPAVLVAHSLGCVLVAAWAAHSRHIARVRAALLVAPGDTEAPDLAARLPGWSPMVRQRLPFASLLLASSNDPYCTLERAQHLAESWGSGFRSLGELGHINAESGLGDWPEGHACLAPWLGNAAA